MALSSKLQASQHLKPSFAIMTSWQMKQALKVLQLPTQELAEFIRNEVEQNPIFILEENHEAAQDVEIESCNSVEDYRELDFLDPHFNQNSLEQNSFDFEDIISEAESVSTPSRSLSTRLVETLQSQAYEHLQTSDLPVIEVIIGSLDKRGFLAETLEEIALLANTTVQETRRILSIFQQFDPTGIGACSYRECLLIQLKRKNWQNCLAYQIIENCYDHWIHQRWKAITKELHCSLDDLKKELNTYILPLKLTPLSEQQLNQPVALIPDAFVTVTNGQIHIEINEQPLPEYHLNIQYRNWLEDSAISAEVKAFIFQKIETMKWLEKTVQQRHETLKNILKMIIKHQYLFFTSTQQSLAPLTMKQIAEELSLHESTVARYCL